MKNQCSSLYALKSGRKRNSAKWLAILLGFLGTPVPFCPVSLTFINFDCWQALLSQFALSSPLSHKQSNNLCSTDEKPRQVGIVKVYKDFQFQHHVKNKIILNTVFIDLSRKTCCRCMKSIAALALVSFHAVTRGDFMRRGGIPNQAPNNSLTLANGIDVFCETCSGVSLLL